jgi:hypothetical protein
MVIALAIPMAKIPTIISDCTGCLASVRRLYRMSCQIVIIASLQFPIAGWQLPFSVLY